MPLATGRPGKDVPVRKHAGTIPYGVETAKAPRTRRSEALIAPYLLSTAGACSVHVLAELAQYSGEVIKRVLAGLLISLGSAALRLNVSTGVHDVFLTFLEHGAEVMLALVPVMPEHGYQDDYDNREHARDYPAGLRFFIRVHRERLEVIGLHCALYSYLHEGGVKG